MPRVDELIERLGPARYLTTLDLTKGYWQVQLTKAAREKSAFTIISPGGLYHRFAPEGARQDIGTGTNQGNSG